MQSDLQRQGKLQVGLLSPTLLLGSVRASSKGLFWFTIHHFVLKVKNK